MTTVHLIATGGTISSTAGPGGLGARLDGHGLLATVGDVPGEVEVVDLTTAPGFALPTDEVLRMRTAVDAAFAAGADGVVVTQGTDTLEECAYALDLLLDDPRPVVFTGAQRAADAPGADGPENLRAALRLAAHPGVRDDGVLVCFDDVAYAARGVTKRHTLATAAFGSSPALHRVVGDDVQRLARSVRRPPLAVADDAVLPRVEVVAAYLGADGTLLRAAVDAGARGVVLAATGIGNATPDVVDAAGEAVERGVVVLVSSRVPEGPVDARYAAGGGALVARGARLAGDLRPWQARVLLTLALAAAPSDPGPLLDAHLGTVP